ncbi:VOC family protein [Bradyrhizobium sp. RDT10]
MKKATSKAIMPIIAVESVDRARNFYVEKLGFDHVMGVVGKDGEFDFVTVVKDGARIMFARAQGPLTDRAKQPVEIYLEVGDVEAYFRHLQKKGVKVTEPLTMQWWGDSTFKVMDPCGYEIWFYQTTGEPKPPEGMKIG